MNIRYPIYEGVYRILTDKGCVGYVVGSYLPILLVSREIGLL